MRARRDTSIYRDAAPRTITRPKPFTRTGLNLVCEFNVDCHEEAEALMWTTTKDGLMALSLACPYHMAEIVLDSCDAP